MRCIALKRHTAPRGTARRRIHTGYVVVRVALHCGDASGVKEVPSLSKILTATYILICVSHRAYTDDWRLVSVIFK